VRAGHVDGHGGARALADTEGVLAGGATVVDMEHFSRWEGRPGGADGPRHDLRRPLRAGAAGAPARRWVAHSKVISALGTGSGAVRGTGRFVATRR